MPERGGAARGPHDRLLPAPARQDVSRRRAASPAEVDALTACVFGAIPPFSFHPDLALVADPLLFERFDEIAFNAGLLEKSVIMDTQDYLRIARPELVTFHKA